MNAAELLSSADFFDCKHFRCRMSKRECARKHLTLKIIVADRAGTIRDDCNLCEIGKVHAAELKMTVNDLKKPIKSNPVFFPDKPKEEEPMKREPVPGSTTKRELFILGACKNCERPDLKIENSPRGLCGTCRQAAPQGAEALAALKERIQTKGMRQGVHNPRSKVASVKQKNRFADQRKSRVAPSLHPGEVIKTLLDEYHESANEAARIMDCLLTLKKYGCDFEMPEIHIVRNER